MKKENLKNKEISDLNQKILELTNGWQRTQADFVNYKKQASEEKARLIKAANIDLISELLPVLDNFQLAAKHLPQELKNNNWAKGIEQIEKQFESILSEIGLEKIASLGQIFDPNIHEAVAEQASNEQDGAIIEEILSGYRYNGFVIRPAKVIVCKSEPR